MAASREDRAYTAALLAFHDKFYSLATNKLTQYLQVYRKSTNAPMAGLLLAQSDYYLGDYAAATSWLADPVNVAAAQAVGLADRYDYWHAEVQYAQGDLQGAAQKLLSVGQNYSNSPVGLNATVEAAAIYAQYTNWAQVDTVLDNASGLFQRSAANDPDGDQVIIGRLLQAESKCAQHAYAAAIPILNLLNPAKLSAEQSWKRSHLLYRAAFGRNDLDAALAAATNLLDIARAAVLLAATNQLQAGRADQASIWSTNLAESVACKAGVLEGKNRLAEAADAWRDNLATNAPAAYQQHAVFKLAELAVARQDLAGAESVLDKFLSQFPDSAASEPALLMLGELQYQDYLAQRPATNGLAAAQARLNQFITTYTNSPLLGKAYLDRGWCYWCAGRYADSFADFQSAAQRLAPSADLAVARFKMGDCQFAQGNYAGAQTNYESVLTDFSAYPQAANALAGSALYQILRARMELHDAPGMYDTMRRLLEKYAATTLADSSLLLAGQGLSDFNSPDKAREVLLRFQRECTNSPLAPEVAFAYARTYERERPPDWLAAVTSYNAWLQTYVTNGLRSQVEYARAWAVSQTGDESRAFILFTNFCADYPASTNTPLAYWWLGDYCFRLGTNFVDAEKYYELIFQHFSTNELANRAQLAAARAAMARFDYSGAIRSYLDPLLKNADCPPDLVTKAKFAYCEALRMITDTNFASLQLATNLLGQIYTQYPTNMQGAQAWCETADIDQLMGVFDAATNAYWQALSLPSAGDELRNRARVGLGDVLRKKADLLPDDDGNGLRSQALDQYLEVLYLRSSDYWIKRAGLNALPLVTRAGVGNAGQAGRLIDRMEQLLPQLKDTLEKKRAAAAGN